MCLTIPGRIETVNGASPTELTAEVDFDGVRRTARLLYVPGVAVGDYVMVHAGFAVRRIEAEEAQEAWRLARELRRSARAEAGVPAARPGTR